MIKRATKKRKSLEEIHKELSISHEIVLTKTKELEELLNDRIQFEFFISYQSSDYAFMVVNSNSSENAPLDKAIQIINKKGILNYSDYSNIAI